MINRSLLPALLTLVTGGRSEEHNCTFSLDRTGVINYCNWTAAVAKYNIYPWDFNIGINVGDLQTGFI